VRQKFYDHTVCTFTFKINVPQTSKNSAEKVSPTWKKHEKSLVSPKYSLCTTETKNHEKFQVLSHVILSKSYGNADTCGFSTLRALKDASQVNIYGLVDFFFFFYTFNTVETLHLKQVLKRATMSDEPRPLNDKMNE
jgi:hypothetical protein